MKQQRRSFFKSALAAGGGAGMAAMAAMAATGERSRVPGGIRVGNLYFSSGLTGVRPDARDVKEQTRNILKTHQKNLESMGSSLANVLKVSVYMAHIKDDKPGMNEVYAEFFPKDAPARTAIGIEFPDDATRLEIDLVAWIPGK